MRRDEAGSRIWHELARIPAPVERRSLWEALLEKTEHPETFTGRLRGAELIDQDPTVVTRRTQKTNGESYIEWVTHTRADVRVELRRRGAAWSRAQALIDTQDGPCLVYQVNDVAAAAESGGIDAAYAHRVLTRLIQHALTPHPPLAL